LSAQCQQLHQRVDQGLPETRKGIRYERGVEVCASHLGLTGKLDLLEIDISNNTYFPVEYKRGNPKKNEIDQVQVCAQALCLEEMLNITVTQGALWYWQTRHRHQIEITQELRHKTKAIIKEVRALLIQGRTPKAKYEKKCNACSLYELCNPKLTYRDKSSAYVKAIYQEDIF